LPMAGSYDRQRRQRSTQPSDQTSEGSAHAAAVVVITRSANYHPSRMAVLGTPSKCDEGGAP
jgi:hypothetical protein